VRVILRPGRVVLLALALLTTATSSDAQQTPARVGVAFGGGSARGLAHLGVIRWFEEHHIPIDVAAGTSMGGLVGGGFAAGMTAQELSALIESTDWDAMFNSTSFPYKNIRRKEDARDFPSRLEFGLKGGIVSPTALNNGQQVDFLLARIAAGYPDLETFDDLPTPFRTIAVDLRTAERVVLDRGSLAEAMRATMSLPGVFPPVEIGNHLLVDGGALDNVPADVVRDMGAAFVVALDVGSVPEEGIDYSMFGLISQTVDTMMRANTRRSLQAADLTIAIDVRGFGSLDWRRSAALIAQGYKAADEHRAELLPHAVDDASWEAWVADRQRRRRSEAVVPASLTTVGITKADAAVIQRRLAHHIGQPLDIPLLETDLSALSGLDRYQALIWQTVGPPDHAELQVRARAKTYAPPFLMLGFNLENTTSSDFRVALAARYLAFDALGPRSELRIDGGIGSDPHVGFALHRPLFGTRAFIRPLASAALRTTDFVQDDKVVAEYRERRVWGGADIGVDISRETEFAGGLRYGRVDSTVRAGDPGLPELGGAETPLMIRLLHDGQDSAIVPSRGTRGSVILTHYLQAPRNSAIERTNDDVTQLEGGTSTFWTPKRDNRLFLVGSGGTSFGGHPISQFQLGYPFRLDAFRVGERRGDHYAVVTVGAAHALGRLPDFMGGPVFAAAWLQNGSAFNSRGDADFNTHLAFGLILDTLLGPVTAGASVGFDGAFRIFIGAGRLTR
jgi:NTE family protein